MCVFFELYFAKKRPMKPKKFNIAVICMLLALFLPPRCSVLHAQQTKEKSFFERLFKQRDKHKKEKKQRKVVSVDKQKALSDEAFMVLDKTFFDFGQLQQGADTHAVFTIKNMGMQDLYILDVELSCGCLDVEFDKGPVGFGQTSQIKIKYNTNIVGQISRSITVLSNDKKKERMTLLLTGEVAPLQSGQRKE